MQGTKSDPGVIPRAVHVRDLSRIPQLKNASYKNFFCQAMFQQKRDLHQFEVSLAMSYMEIYKDDVYDLLVTRENVRFHYTSQACRP